MYDKVNLLEYNIRKPVQIPIQQQKCSISIQFYIPYAICYFIFYITILYIYMILLLFQ